jgi:hypothetical protein
MSDTETFVLGLVQRVSGLKPLYDEHIRDNDGLLPHVFMGEITRFAIAESGNSESRDAIATLLQSLENGLRTGSDEVTELIVVSFVENLMGEEIALKSLKPLMGPLLKGEVEHICES